MSRPVNSSKAAISVVQAPDSCSSMPHAADEVVVHDAPHGPDDAVAVGLGGRLGLDFQGAQPRDAGDLGDLIADGLSEHLTHI